MIYVKDISLGREGEKTDYRKLHETAYDLLKVAIKKEYPELEGKLTMRRQSHGKPYFVVQEEENVQKSDVQFNISHSFDKVVCVIGKGEFGIDVEKIRPWSEKVAKRILHPLELEYLENSLSKDEVFIRFWTLKEAYGKYCGKGVGIDFKKLIFSPEHWSKQENEIRSNQENLLFLQWKIDSNYFLSLCIEKDRKDISTLTNLCFDDKIESC